MRLFVDSSVIIYGLEMSESNSKTILDLLYEGEVDGAINEKVIDEVRRYFTNRRDRHYAFLIESMLRETFAVIGLHEIKAEAEKLKGCVKEKDLLHLATVRVENIRYLVAYDRDFDRIPEYITPKGLLKKLGRKTGATEY